jgi:hypothetical protein
MPSTYLELCNQTLRRLNEVEIAADDFANVRGVQALVKDAVKAAIARVNQSEFEWPFNSAQHNATLVVGQTEYTWPDFFKVADMNTFQIVADSSLNVNYKTLKSLDRDEWYKKHRDDDYNAGNSGRGVPEFVFDTHGNGYGVTPSPDKAYNLTFRYYLNYSDINNATDVTRIPTSFDTVIIDGALYHMYMFKDNLESAQAAFMSFEKGLKDLQTLYINNFEYVRDTRVRF